MPAENEMLITEYSGLRYILYEPYEPFTPPGKFAKIELGRK